MPTRSERKALLFFASVALLGAGWRTVRTGGAAEPSHGERGALAAQIAAVDSARAGRHRTPARASSSASGASTALIDVDRASERELDKLPRIGPALARRIVEDRDANGPFGSLDALQRVRGIGPVMAAALAPRVTFSTNRRPTDAATFRPLTLPALWPTAAPRKAQR